MKHFLILIFTVAVCSISHAQACTGIHITAADGSAFFARTFEWAYAPTYPMIETVPRGTSYSSSTPRHTKGMTWKNKYGFVGITSSKSPYINEGVNEAGLSAGMFFFDRYAGYMDYDSTLAAGTVDALDVSRYLLSTCSTVSEAKRALKGIRITGSFRQEIGKVVPLHWRVGDAAGECIVVECTGGVLHVYDDSIGVITNSPDYPWQVANLCNYINISPAPAAEKKMGGVTLYPTGSGSGLLGLPGDFTPVSRFVRAAFFLSYSKIPKDAYAAMCLCFNILSNFNIPLSGELTPSAAPDIPAATQWTCVTDASNRILYYRTMYNSSIRRIDLSKVDFSRGKDRHTPLDTQLRETITDVIP